MALRPLYTPEDVRPVHNLRYDWTGWLRAGAHFPATAGAAVASCRPAWSRDGLTLDHWEATGHRIQCLFSALPEVSPAGCAGRAKGRLQHAFRQLGHPVSFMRNVAIRTLGDNTRGIVARYLKKQVGKSDLVDPRFRAHLLTFTVDDPSVCLATSSVSGHGRYWYNLHLVIVVVDRRFPMTQSATFATIRAEASRIAREEGHRIAELAIMPDHVHMALRGDLGDSPLDIGLAFLNGLALALGNNRCWSREFYLGTFSEYRVQAIAGVPAASAGRGRV